MNSYSNLSLLREDLRNGQQSLPDIVNNFLTKIREKSDLNAFLEVFEDEAREQAEIIQEKISRGQDGKLAGLVIGIKDNICYRDHKVSASSKILEGFESLYSATVVERLLKEDAIIIGRLNCDEFAMGSSNENSAYGKVLNPHDRERVAGGSSGGSAAAVAAGLCHATLGSDTGGSIRQPASFCGVVGLKPTYGRVSRYGLVAYGSSMDQIGPLTTHVEDAAAILEVIAGKDDHDATSSSEEVISYSRNLNFDKKIKVASLTDCMEMEGISPELLDKQNSFLSFLEKEGHTVTRESFGFLDYVVPVYQILSNAEASSNLSRYDGILYGHRSKEAETLEDTLVSSRTEGFGTEVKRRIMLGTFVLSEGYYDAYYSKAQKVRNLIRRKTAEILSRNDFIVLPTSPGPAFKIGQKSQDPISMYLEDIFTLQAPLSGNPAISLPLWKDENGMPMGLQVIGNNFAESELLSFSNYLMSRYK